MEYLLLHDYRVHYNKHHERYCEQCVSVQDAWRTVIERFWSQIAIAALLTWIREDQASDEAIDFSFGLEACNGSLYIGP